METEPFGDSGKMSFEGIRTAEGAITTQELRRQKGPEDLVPGDG